MPILRNRGVVVTDESPNLVSGIATSSESPVAYDSIARILYRFDPSLAVGNRWVAQLVADAENGLRVNGSSKVVLGSDSYTLPKGSALIENTYVHTGTQSLSFVGDYYGTPMTNLKMESTGILRYNAESDAIQFPGNNLTGRISADYGNIFFSIAGTTPQLSGWYNSSLAAILGGTEHNMTNAQGSFIGAGYGGTITSAYSGMIGGHTISISGINSGAFGGQSNTISGAYSFAGGGESVNITGDYGSALGGLHLNVNARHMVGLGYYGVVFSGMTTNSNVLTDQMFVIGNGLSTSNRSNSLTVLKNGRTQINSISTTPKTQVQCTPGATLDVVSVDSGILAPRLTSAQVTTLLGSLNLTTDVTGGAAGNAYSKKGMMVECTDCTSLDGTTDGVTLKLYPNAALSSWVAKKLW